MDLLLQLQQSQHHKDLQTVVELDLVADHFGYGEWFQYIFLSVWNEQILLLHYYN